MRETLLIITLLGFFFLNKESALKIEFVAINCKHHQQRHWRSVHVTHFNREKQKLQISMNSADNCTQICLHRQDLFSDRLLTVSTMKHDHVCHQQLQE